MKTKTNLMKQNQSPVMKNGKIVAYLMILPGLVHFLIFWLYTNYSSIIIAFTDGNGEFTLFNFQRLFMELGQKDTDIYVALINTFKYFLMNLFKCVMACFIAYFFYKKVYLHKLYKLLFFLPSMIPGVVYISVFKNFIIKYGPLWTILQTLFGYELPALLMSPDTATPTILFYVLWSGFGMQMLIFVGTMNRIPEEIIDAAKLDGCIGMKEFVLIIIPLIWETLATYLLLEISSVFLASGPILYFTGGESYTKTTTLSFWIFQQVSGGKYNYPSAIGLFFTVIALPLVFVTRFFMNKIETVSY